MEKKITNLFDFQRFEHNSKLKSVLQDVEGHYTAALDDNDLAFVSAAGEDIPLSAENPDMMQPKAEEDSYPKDTRIGAVILLPMTQHEGQ